MCTRRTPKLTEQKSIRRLPSRKLQVAGRGSRKFGTRLLASKIYDLN